MFGMVLNLPKVWYARYAEFIVFAFGSTLILLVWLNRPQDYVHLAVLYWPLILLAVIHAHVGLAKKYSPYDIPSRRALAAEAVKVVDEVNMQLAIGAHSSSSTLLELGPGKDFF